MSHLRLYKYISLHHQHAASAAGSAETCPGRGAARGECRADVRGCGVSE